MTCFVCGRQGHCGAYRLGGPGIVNVYLCDVCGESLEKVIAAWLEAERARPRQQSIFD